MKEKGRATDVRLDRLEAIRKAHPDNTVKMMIGSDESYLRGVYPKLKEALSEIYGTELSYERDAEGNEFSPALSGAEKVSDWGESYFSYVLFFVGLVDEQYRYLCETVVPDEDGEERQVEGKGMIGCMVAVSLLAPYALLELRSLERYKGGDQATPEIDHPVYSLEGEPIEMKVHFRETMGEEAVEALQKTSERIEAILKSAGISILPEEDEEKPVGWLQAGEGVLVGPEHTGKEVTVKEAFFFRGR